MGAPPMTEREALMVSPIRLAYLGDTVHDLFVRTRLARGGEHVRAMHKEAVGAVNAGAQAQALARVLPLLNETEADVVRRGRNAHARHAAPRRANPRDYAQATGLEALLGFLYITGQSERLLTLLEAMQKEGSECPNA